MRIAILGFITTPMVVGAAERLAGRCTAKKLSSRWRRYNAAAHELPAVRSSFVRSQSTQLGQVAVNGLLNKSSDTDNIKTIE